jgi:RNA polymerase sigma factor (sigma-70 family)
VTTIEHAPGAPAPDDVERRFLELLPVVRNIVAFLARRYCLSGADLEDFTSEVFVKLIEDDYAVLRKFRRSSSMRTYLSVTIARLLIDRTNKEWGRWRPSAEARRRGPIAIRLEKLVVRDGYSGDEACEILLTNDEVPLTRTQLEALLERIPGRRGRKFEPIETIDDLPASSVPPDTALLRDEHRVTAARLIRVLAEVMRTLPAQDRVILKMRFEDGLTIAAIAMALRLETKRLYGRLERLLTRLRLELHQRGFQRDDLELFLQLGETD